MTSYRDEWWEVEREKQEREMMERAEEESYTAALRPEAVPYSIEYSSVVVGDFISAEAQEKGVAEARWVEIVELKSKQNGDIQVTFKTPVPMTRGMHDRWVIERRPDDLVTIDSNARHVRIEQALEEGKRVRVGGHDEFYELDLEGDALEVSELHEGPHVAFVNKLEGVFKKKRVGMYVHDLSLIEEHEGE